MIEGLKVVVVTVEVRLKSDFHGGGIHLNACIDGILLIIIFSPTQIAPKKPLHNF